MSLDPDGTSFWTGDSTSGDVWQVNIATGAVDAEIDTHSGSLYGLSVDDQIEVAAPAAGHHGGADDAHGPPGHRQLLDAHARSRPC